MNVTDLDKKLATLESRHRELETLMADPETASDPALLQRYGREYSGLNEVVGLYQELRKTRDEIASTEGMLDDGLDPDMKELAHAELSELKAREEEQTEALRISLLPKDIMDDRDAIVTIQAGAGGDEAGLFVADLFRMYTRYADTHRWQVEVLDSNESGIGGFKEVVMEVRGKGAYSRLKYEGGTHRV